MRVGHLSSSHVSLASRHVLRAQPRGCATSASVYINIYIHRLRPRMTVRIDKSPKMNTTLIFSRKRIQKLLCINTDMALDAAVPDLGIMLKLLSYNSHSYNYSYNYFNKLSS